MGLEVVRNSCWKSEICDSRWLLYPRFLCLNKIEMYNSIDLYVGDGRIYHNTYTGAKLIYHKLHINIHHVKPCGIEALNFIASIADHQRETMSHIDRKTDLIKET